MKKIAVPSAAILLLAFLVICCDNSSPAGFDITPENEQKGAITDNEIIPELLENIDINENGNLILNSNGIENYYTGTNTDIEALLTASTVKIQQEYDSQYIDIVKKQWLKKAYTDLYADISNFTNTAIARYRSSTTFSPMLTSSSNTGVVTAEANADALETSHAVEVRTLASNAFLITKNKISRNENAEAGSIFLKNIIKNYTNGNLSFEVSDGTDTKTITITEDKINNSNFTLNDLVSNINKAGLKIHASYDAQNDSFAVVNTAAGKNNFAGFRAKDDNAAALLNSLNLCGVELVDGKKELSEKNFASGMMVGQYGVDAAVIIDGKQYSGSSNKITVSNVTYNLTKIGKSTITVTCDQDQIIENTKSFVEDYNMMLDKLNYLYKEEPQSEYHVLTKEDEASMTPEQIEKWNEKARSGLLYRDSIIFKMINNMHSDILTVVTSADRPYNMLASIGISSVDSSGSIQLDKTKLNDALADNSKCAYQIFCSENGIAYKLYDTLKNTMEEIKEMAGISEDINDGSYLGNLIQHMKVRLLNIQANLEKQNKILREKYQSLESELNKLLENQQLGQ